MTTPQSHEHFEPCIGQAFEVARDQEPCTLELIEVKRIADEAYPSSGRAPFALLFRGPCEPALDQGIYELRNERIGDDAIFLVPVGADPEGALYEAVFN